jgi:hypothetical protein
MKSILIFICVFALSFFAVFSSAEVYHYDGECVATLPQKSDYAKKVCMTSLDDGFNYKDCSGVQEVTKGVRFGEILVCDSLDDVKQISKPIKAQPEDKSETVIINTNLVKIQEIEVDVFEGSVQFGENTICNDCDEKVEIIDFSKPQKVEKESFVHKMINIVVSCFWN